MLDNKGYRRTPFDCSTVDFLLQQWLHQCAAVLRCTYIACLVRLLERMIYSDVTVKFICMLHTENIVVCTMGNVECKRNATCNLRS